MPLRFDLGPFEKLFIGKSVLTNNSNRAMFVIEGETPILRARDVLRPEQATNALEKLYRCIQQMYLEEDDQKYLRLYSVLAAQAISERPACCTEIRFVEQMIKTGQHYKALRSLKRLIPQQAFSFVDSGALV
jgi:flagellar biosynthesis repressor protein FlbT